jgi:SAM-dependent methyltransferase
VTVDQLEQYYLANMSSDSRAFFEGLGEERQEVRDFMRRAFVRMDRIHFGPEEVNEMVAWILGSLIPRILPGAWGGMVPPITMSGRHHRIDRYLAINQWVEMSERPIVLDVGCGFPPLTTIELAQRYPRWQVVGADPSFEPYLVYDSQGDYAFLDEGGQVKYFQSSGVELSHWDELFADPQETVTRFTELFRELREGLRNQPYPETVARNGSRLIHQPLAEFQKPNLCFSKGAFGNVDVANVDIVRSLNVLVYFDRAFRQRAVEWAGTLLRTGGIFLYGMDNFRNLEAYYRVFRKEDGGMVEREFAFSIDVVRPVSIVPWFSIHEDDPEGDDLMGTIRILRSDDDFRSSFDARLDALLAEAGICPRGEDGNLGAVPDGLAKEEWEARLERVGDQLVVEGFVDHAVEILRGAGIESWRNEIDHIAIRTGTH